MRVMPTVAEERNAGAAARLGESAPGPWRRNGPILSLVFFFLTALGVAAAWALTSILRLPEGLTVGVAAIAFAEILILRGRFFGTGVESALWLCGLFALITELPRSGRPEAILVVAAAAAVAGLRVRNPYFGALAVILALSYFGTAIALGVGLVALIALAREWRRPSTETLWIAVLLVAPVTAAVMGQLQLSRAWAAVYAAFAVAALFAGVRLREHAPLLASGIALIIAVIEARMPIALEWQLLTGGAILVAMSAALTRALRRNDRGFVTTPASFTAHDEGLETAATLALQPQAEAPTASPAGGGGSFGGAGATGKF